MVPGSNILNMAMSVIGKQKLLYFKYLSRDTNAIGLDESNYAAGVTIYGSFQPVARNLYEAYGLDFNRIYYVLYASVNIMEVLRNSSGDQLGFNGQRFQVEASGGDWFVIDGWKGILCVQISPQNSAIFGVGKDNKNFGNGAFDA